MNASTTKALLDSQGRVSHEIPRDIWVRPWLMVLLVCVATTYVGCASVFMPGGPSEHEIQAMIERNNRNLLRLQVGMFEEHVSDIMGEPQRLEVYSWGTAWCYRTAMTNGARTAPETDLTPLVFDRRGVLLGWGRDFLADHIKQYE
jgi:Protein of unknown function (DUF3192)